MQLATKLGLNLPEGVEAHEVPSLERLRTDHVDLYYPHFPDPTVAIEETVAAIVPLVEEGLVRHIGLSNVTAEQLELAAAVHPIAAVQVEWSLWNRGIEGDLLLRLAERLGAGLGAARQRLPDRPGGARRGRLPPQRAPLPGREPGPQPRPLRALRELAAEAGATPAQLALAWLWRATRAACRSPAAVLRPTSRRTWPPPTWTSIPACWPGSTSAAAVASGETLL